MEASAGTWILGSGGRRHRRHRRWVAWEKRYRSRGGAPMVDLSLLAIPSFAYGSLAIAVYFLGYTSVWITWPSTSRPAWDPPRWPAASSESRPPWRDRSLPPSPAAG